MSVCEAKGSAAAERRPGQADQTKETSTKKPKEPRTKKRESQVAVERLSDYVPPLAFYIDAK